MPPTKTAAKPAPQGCTPFSVSVDFLTPDDEKQIHFGLTKGCNPDNTPFWTIDFLLKEQKGTTFKTRVEVHVVLGTDQEKAKAEKLAAKLKETKTLSAGRVDLLQGEAADRAAELPEGTKTDSELEEILKGVL